MEIKLKSCKRYSICSCGQSQTLPYCDNAHREFNVLNNTEYKSVKITPDRDVVIQVNSSRWMLDPGNESWKMLNFNMICNTLIPIEHEIADVFIYLIRIANKMGIDVEDAVYKKLELNKLKYPIEDNRGVVNKIWRKMF